MKPELPEQVENLHRDLLTMRQIDAAVRCIGKRVRHKPVPGTTRTIAHPAGGLERVSSMQMAGIGQTALILGMTGMRLPASFMKWC